MLIQPDFSEAVEFTPLTAGTYSARITSCEEKTSQAGNVYLKWTLETFGSGNPANNNQKVWHTTPTKGKGAGILLAFIKAATGEAPQGNFDTDTLLGREIKITVVDGKNHTTGEPTGYVEVKSVARLAA